MIVKFFKNSGGGSANATMNYLLGKENEREGARLLSGDPELTKRMSDSLNFQNRYTVGVLSFEEVNLPDEDKRAIMESFESSLLAGLDKNQYNMTWIEHTDKDRLELNFVIANVELTTGKRLQPYFDRVDRPLVENWKQVTNHEYGLTDPHDPDKAQAVKTLNRQNLPKEVQQVKAQIGQAISHQIEQGNITDRKGVIDTLEQAGFEIARITDKSISIKNPEGKRNIRLEGVIYENRQLGKELGEDHSRARQDYAGTGAERYQTALSKLQRAIKVKQERNRASFSREHQSYQREQKQHTASLSVQNDARGINGRSTDYISHSVDSNRMDRDKSKGQEKGISRDNGKDRTITFGSAGFSKNGSQTEPRQQHLDSSQRPQEVASRDKHQWQAEYATGVSNDAKRLFNTLQRASGRTGNKDLTTTNTNRAIDSSQSSFKQAKQLITTTNTSIGEREQQTKQRERHAQQVIEASQQTEKKISRGIDLEL